MRLYKELKKTLKNMYKRQSEKKICTRVFVWFFPKSMCKTFFFDFVSKIHPKMFFTFYPKGFQCRNRCSL